MRRLPVAGSILVSGLLAIGGLGSAALAQSASPMPTDESPAVGAWVLTIADNPTSPPQEIILHADGTYLQYDGTGGVSIGAWEATGPNTGTITLVQYGLDDTGKVGHSTIRATFEVAPDGNSLTAAYTVEYFGADGSDTGQMGPGSATGTRVVVEPMGSPVMPLQGPPASPAASTAP
jgi:hypothetical protein